MTVIGGVPVGFTGTRAGMTVNQQITVTRLVRDTRMATFHHGNAKGADKQARDIVRWQKTDEPPVITKYDAGDDPLARNKLIVQASDWLIATPRLDREEVRSGTWHTIRYARQLGKRVIIVWPNGETKIEEPKTVKKS